MTCCQLTERYFNVVLLARRLSNTLRILLLQLYDTFAAIHLPQTHHKMWCSSFHCTSLQFLALVCLAFSLSIVALPYGLTPRSVQWQPGVYIWTACCEQGRKATLLVM